MGWETADQLEKGIVRSSNRKSRDLEGETADQLEKRDRGLTGSHVIWDGKPLTSGKKGSWAQVGRKVQSPILGTGVILESKKRGKLMLLKIFLMETIEGSSI